MGDSREAWRALSSPSRRLLPIWISVRRNAELSSGTHRLAGVPRRRDLQRARSELALPRDSSLAVFPGPSSAYALISRHMSANPGIAGTLSR